MYESFESQLEEKKKKIIDACIEEFARNGYHKASTNEIVKRAGISKGILFHYFGNKKNLFLYIVDYVMDYSIKKFYIINSEPSTDIFERIMQQGVVKLKLAYEEPLMYEMMFKTFINVPEELKQDIQERYVKIYNEQMPYFFKDLDTSRFKSDINPARAIEIIMLLVEALSNKYINMLKDKSPGEVLAQMDKITQEYMECFEILKKGMYK